ncbi:MAG: hypothetical protein K2Q22_05055, partial [Cytophagales bacterium]|nr:hypothetical protein [Cytophagales bacterium]
NSPSGNQLGTGCKTLIQNGTDDPISINVPCNEDLDDFTDDVNTDVLRAKFESCGLCPLARDVEQLIMDLKDNRSLATITSPGVLLSCQNDKFPVTPGDLLLSELKANSTTTQNNPDIYWKVSLSPNGRNLTGTFSNTSISLALSYSSLVPTTVNSTFANLTKLCCLSVVGYVNPTNTTLGQVFVMQSSYSDPLLGDIPFLVTGTVNLGLNPCSFPPKCQTTDDASRVAQFLNILTATASGTNKTNDLVTASVDKTLSDASVLDFYQNAVRTLIKKDNYDVPGGYIQDMSTIPTTWNSQVSSDGTKLSGVFQYVLNGDTKAIVIDINNLPSGFSFSEIRQFFRIRPDKNLPSNDPCRTSNCNKQKFLVDAVLYQGDSRFVKTVEIEVPSLNPVICRPPIIIGSN